jgi:hypothetical protein
MYILMPTNGIIDVMGYSREEITEGTPSNWAVG